MTLIASSELWDSHAKKDPLWAILSDPAKKGGQWDLQRFFQTGVGEISFVMYQLQSRGVPLPRRSAFDFGCGVGRLTQALAPHFERVVGVDVSPKMIELAKSLNRYSDRVRYACNQRPDLHAFEDGSFDFVLSNIVLQHIEPQHARAYVREFHRLLAPGGVLAFQLPSHRRAPDDVPPGPRVRDMAEDAYKASLSVTGMPHAPVAPGTEIVLDVEVTNASSHSWSEEEFGTVRVGNQWLDAAGLAIVQRDDGRSSLPGALHPGDAHRVSLTIAAPASDGEYVCVVDLVHEGVVWFGEKGSRTVRFVVRVGKTAVANVAGDTTRRVPTVDTDRVAATIENELDSEEPTEFPMHSIPISDVVSLITAAGGELVAIELDHSCGADWVSYRYFVRKAAPASRS